MLLALALAVCVPARAGERVTVQRLEQILAAGEPVRTSDSENPGATDLLDEIQREDSLEPRLESLELTERLTDATRLKLAAKYKLGPLSKSALEVLADRSVFLDVPASEVLDQAAPDGEAQRKMMERASVYVYQTLQHLPDFFALLATREFSDRPAMAGGQTLTGGDGMHQVGESQHEITFSDGREVFDSAQPGRGAHKAGGALQSQGEFGAEAATVFLDLAKGKIGFAHWERGAGGPVAVFRYAVPAGSSHYAVSATCGGRATFHNTPAYHGTMSIDPAAGVLVRLTVETEWAKDDPITHVGSEIEYAPVELGKQRYYLPTRSLARTAQEADTCLHDQRKNRLERPVAMLNRIVFSDYHRLGSEMEIVPGAQPPAQPGEGAEGSDPRPPDLPPTPPAPSPVPPSH